MIEHDELIERFQTQLTQAIADDTFVRLVLSGVSDQSKFPAKVTARLVTLRGQPRVSLLSRGSTGETTRNLPIGEAVDWVRTQVGAVYRSTLLGTTRRDWQLHLPADGPGKLVHHKPAQAQPVPREHDQTRHETLDDSAADWLRGLGIVDEAGKVIPRMADKHRQINRYVELLSHLAKDCGWPPDAAGKEAKETAPAKPKKSSKPHVFTIADMGSGKGYLTFGVWHLFQRMLGMPVRVIGVEQRQELVELASRLARNLPAEGLEFVRGEIAQARLPKLDAMIALHACNTATDAAILRGIEQGAKLIIVSPCCHQELRPQLQQPEPLAGILRHGIMAERFAEWLTDGLRALYLEWAGYQTKIIEFVPTEHTAKNLLIAAIRTGEPFADPALRERIVQLKSQFGIEQQSLDSLLETHGN